MAETWRVVLASGEVREVRVSFEPYPGAINDEPCQYVARCDDAEAESTASAHDAALWLASCHEWSAVEILAPGEPTRAEVLAQLAPMTRAVDALRAAAVAAGHPAADGDPDAQICAVRAAAWNAGAEVMREAIVQDPHMILSDYDEGRIRALPVPPCPWGVCCGTGEVSR